MHVLHVVHFYPPETHGGTQSFVEELAALQLAAGHRLSVVAGARGHAPGGALEVTEQAGVRVHRVLRDLPGEALSGDLGSARIGTVVEGVVRELGPDLVHVHHWQALTRDIVRRVGGADRPVVVTLHDLFTTCPRNFRMPDARHFCAPEVTLADCAACVSVDAPGKSLDELERLLRERRLELQAELAAAAVVLAVSEAQRELLLSLPGFGHREVRALPIGILTDEAPPPAPAPVPGRLRVVNWAGLDPRKGLHLLLAAVSGSARRGQFEVHLHGRDGDPEYMAELRALGEGLDLHLHGPYEDRDRLAFAGRYDVAVFPFLAFETHGMVVDEALRAGLPVLVSDRGAPPARLGGRGRTFRTDDSADLRARLEDLLDAPDELARMRAAPHGAIDLREHARALEALYAELASGA